MVKGPSRERGISSVGGELIEGSEHLLPHFIRFPSPTVVLVIIKYPFVERGWEG